MPSTKLLVKAEPHCSILNKIWQDLHCLMDKSFCQEQACATSAHVCPLDIDVLSVWGKMYLGSVTRSLLPRLVVWRSAAGRGLAVVSYLPYPSRIIAVI